MLRFRDLSASFSRFWGLRFRSRVLRFRDLGCFVFDLGCFVFEIWVLRFRVLSASFSSFGCFVLRSSFSSASFSKLPNMAAVSVKRSIGQEDKRKARDTHTPTHGLASTTCVVWSACTRLGSKD